MLSDYFTTTFTVKRMTWVNESSSKISQGSITGNLQQADANLIENLRMDFTRSYKVYCALDADVETGDTLINGSDTYSVRAIKELLVGNFQHKMLIIEKDIQEV